MASGFPGGGDPGFYGGIGGSEGRPIGGNAGGNLYRFQQQQLRGGLVDPGAQIGYRRPDFLMIGKRSLAEFQSSSHPPQPNLFQQGLGGGGGLFLRSVKQRTVGFNGGFQNQNHSLSPISPLSSIDLCSPSNNLSQDHSPSLSSASAGYGVPLYPKHYRHHLQQPSPVSPITQNPSNRVPENSNKMMTTLQELEKQLLDDDDNGNGDQIGGGGGEGEGEGEDAVSAITNSEWSETFKDLISPKPSPTTNTTAANTPTNNNNSNTISPSPASSSSSSCSSSKTPPPPPTAKPAQLILEAATAFMDGKSEESAEALSRLAHLARPTGDPEQRLAFYMLHALRCRFSPAENTPQVAELYGSDHLTAFHALFDFSPCFKFALRISNQLILQAIASTMKENTVNGKKVVHIVDFNVGHGKQYMNLLRPLVAQIRPSGVPLEIKITAVETEMRNDQETSKRLEAVRDSLMKLTAARFSLRFNAVTLAVNDLTRESLGCDDDEVLVVNFAFWLYRVPDESVSIDNLRDQLLRRVHAMQPRVVTMAEQELNANTAPLPTRVGECTAYYGALLQSLELELARENPDRVRVEKAVGRKMSNAVLCEGRERVERCEVFGKWRARMGMAGFKPTPAGHGVIASMRDNLSDPARRGNPNFTVKEENGGVCFGWMGRTLTVASAWR